MLISNTGYVGVNSFVKALMAVFLLVWAVWRNGNWPGVSGPCGFLREYSFCPRRYLNPRLSVFMNSSLTSKPRGLIRGTESRSLL